MLAVRTTQSAPAFFSGAFFHEREDERDRQRTEGARRSTAGLMPSSVRLAVSFNFVVKTPLLPLFVATIIFFFYPIYTSAAAAAAVLLWAGYVVSDGCEFREGRPDPNRSHDAWFIQTMRRYLRVQLHRAPDVDQALLAASKTGTGQVGSPRGRCKQLASSTPRPAG